MNKKVKKKEKELTQKITCYWCKKSKGVARRVWTYTRAGKGPKKVKKWLWVWQAKGFHPVYGSNWICDKCIKRKCKRCGVLLSNTRVCPACGIKHGAYYRKHSGYCKDCFDIISNKDNE